MKSLVKGFMFVVIYIVSVLFISVVVQRYIKYNELNRIVSLSLQQSQRVLLDQRYKIDNNETYLLEFNSHLIRYAHYCKDFHIDIYGIDYQKGLIDVEVSTSLNYPFFDDGMIKLRKTSIIDKNGGDDHGIRDE